MKNYMAAAVSAAFFAQLAFAAGADELSACDKLVALYIELAERSGATATEAQARAEILSDNPTQAECAAMLALFEVRK